MCLGRGWRIRCGESYRYIFSEVKSHTVTKLPGDLSFCRNNCGGLVPGVHPYCTIVFPFFCAPLENERFKRRVVDRKRIGVVLFDAFLHRCLTMGLFLFARRAGFEPATRFQVVLTTCGLTPPVRALAGLRVRLPISPPALFKTRPNFRPVRIKMKYNFTAKIHCGFENCNSGNKKAPPLWSG